MTIDIITLFPKMFAGPFEESIVKRAVNKGFLKINLHNLRNWAIDKRGTVDGRPYGGSVGMLLRPEPIFKAVDFLREVQPVNKASPATAGRAFTPAKRGQVEPQKTILLDPAGRLYNQEMTRRFAKYEHIILICGHYEGVDYRVHEHLADEVVSIGDYILTGGEIPAMVLVDSLTRLLPGALTKPTATSSESFSLYPSPTWVKSPKSNLGKITLLEFSQYTRPENFHGLKVPKVLLSGNHAEIEKWRKDQALKRTRQFRPDLLSLKKWVA